ncbi:cation transporter [Corynebacterium sp. TA-R-1]|uniref:Cation transporter n=1 Tax=Corynebacterium stercoris TaxID=2943490 RepID=A0ABT1G0U9_9CORY|nr:cation transporter [Corynebacterium stercoris]MCP1387654.1 cation transporter [Corynebacterium stercoris]
MSRRDRTTDPPRRAHRGAAQLGLLLCRVLEDTAINLLVFVAVAWPAERRRAVGGVLAGLILIPAIAAIAMVVHKLLNQVPPSEGLTVTAVGALIVNLICAVILLRVRDAGSSLTTGAWLAARNDALANILIIIAGLIIAAVNFFAFKEVWEESREEHDSVEEAFAEMDCD